MGFSAAIDPADGSIAEAAPLGDDMSMLNDAMIAFKEPRAVEIINGRVAMIGWMAALSAEISNDQSLTRQVLNTRTFTLADGVVKTSTMPAEGMFLIPVTVLAVLAASLAPVLRGNEESGLEKAPKDFGPRREVHQRRSLLSGEKIRSLRLSHLASLAAPFVDTPTDAPRFGRDARCTHTRDILLIH